MKQHVRLDHQRHSIEIEVVELGSECWSVRVTVSSKKGAAWFGERSAKRWIDNQSSTAE